jgi:hypothetical protein
MTDFSAPSNMDDRFFRSFYTDGGFFRSFCKDDGFFRSFYTDDGFFRQPHTVVRGRVIAWFFYNSDINSYGGVRNIYMLKKYVKITCNR